MNEEQEQRLDNLFHTKIGLHLCGCGRPNEVMKFIYKMIELQNNYILDKSDYAFESRQTTLENLIEETPKDIIFEFIFHVLENANIVDHGCSVYGSRLSTLGEEFYELLKIKFKQ